MTDPQDAVRIERAKEGWGYAIDASYAPACVVYTAQGTPSQDLIESSASDLLALMDRIVGPDVPFCPVIADVGGLQGGKMGAATFQWASSRAIRRLTRLIVVFDPDLLTRRMYASFMRIATVVVPRIEVAYSYEEALERLGVEIPPDSAEKLT